MKTGIFAVAGLGFLTAVAAQPHRVHRHPRNLGYGHKLKREVVTEVTVETTIAHVVVFVDENDVPYTTVTEDTSTLAPQTQVAAASGASVKVDSPTSATVSSSVATNSFSGGARSSTGSLGTVDVAAVFTSSFATSVAVSESSAMAESSVIVESSSIVEPTVEKVTSAPATTSAQVSVTESMSDLPEATSESSSLEVATTSFIAQPQVQSTDSPSSTPYVGGSSQQGFPWGIAYSPYTTGPCKDANQILSDFKAMGDQYKLVRIYGTDCQQVENAFAAAKATDKQLMLGLFYIDQIQSEVQSLSDTVGGDWSRIPVITVGNEDLAKGAHTAADMVNAMQWARGNLTAVGFKGILGVVDTVDSVLNNPDICTASDVVMVNAHAFFDSIHEASEAGTTIRNQIDQVQMKCQKDGKPMRVIITESGWPKNGERNGKAIPSSDNQKAAIASLKSVFNSDIIFFTAFNADWAQNNAYTFGAEQYWGILDTPQ